MPRPHPLRSLLILSLAALAFALAQTMLIPALTELAKSLDTDASGVAWTVTAYLLAAEQERDPAVWRHYARLVVDALRTQN